MRRLALLLLAGVVAGCTTSNPDAVLGPTDANVTGTFNLESAGGQLLPLLEGQDATYQYYLTGDQLVISPDGTFTETTTITGYSYATGAPTASTGVTTGTYSIVDQKIQFVETGGGTEQFLGSVSGNTLYLVYNGSRFVYSR